MFEQVFIDSMQNFTADQALIKGLWSEIFTHYSSSNRHYHNLSHLDYLVNELLQVKGRITNWDLVVFSIAYHDIIYEIERSDNEEKSAGYAASALSALLAPFQIDKCKQAILATKTHQYNNDSDINYFTDADLSVLGATPELYLEYSRQIRKEYGSYPDFMYKPGRQKVIEHFLHMERIYKTGFFFNKYERQARSNLKMEQDQLCT
jgi:predicted metal-dependent HD superfamily phosphohydrolase